MAVTSDMRGTTMINIAGSTSGAALMRASVITQQSLVHHVLTKQIDEAGLTG